jgi:hypothetical protein
MKDNWHWDDNVKIYICRSDGTEELVELRNKIQDVGVNLFRDALKGIVTDLAIKYMAWGTTGGSDTSAHTKLIAEVGRKAVTLQTSGATGILVTATYIGPSEAVGVAIEELGWFAGVGATAAADSGVLVARALYSHTKTAIENVVVARTDTLAGV